MSLKPIWVWHLTWREVEHHCEIFYIENIITDVFLKKIVYFRQCYTGDIFSKGNQFIWLFFFSHGYCLEDKWHHLPWLGARQDPFLRMGVEECSQVSLWLIGQRNMIDCLPAKIIRLYQISHHLYVVIFIQLLWQTKKFEVVILFYHCH